MNAAPPPLRARRTLHQREVWTSCDVQCGEVWTLGNSYIAVILKKKNLNNFIYKHTHIQTLQTFSKKFPMAPKQSSQRKSNTAKNIFPQSSPEPAPYIPQMERAFFSPPQFQYQSMPPQFQYPQSPFNPFFGTPTGGPSAAFTEPQPQHIDTSDSSDDAVPETQTEDLEESKPEDIPLQRKSRKKPTGPAPAQAWTEDEEVMLARAWVAVSEDCEAGNTQSKAHFWETIRVVFHKNLGREFYRSKDTLTTKFRVVNGYANKFNGLFVNFMGQRESGESNQDILKKAFSVYQHDNKDKLFRHMAFWEVVHQYLRWKGVGTDPAPTHGSKRSKTSETQYTTSSNAHIGVDVNEIPDDFERPVGRNRAKAKGKAAALSSSVNDGKMDDVNEKFDQVLSTISTHVKSTEEERLARKTSRENKNRALDMLVLMQPTEHLTGATLELALKLKNDIVKKYGM